MAYRIAALGLAAVLATRVVAQPMAGAGDVYVTTTCTASATVVVKVDQYGHTLAPEAPTKFGDVKAANLKEEKPKGKPLNYGNFKHSNFHGGKKVDTPAVPVVDTKKDTYVPPAVEDTKKEEPAPIPIVKETPKKETTTPAPKDNPPAPSGGGGSGMGAGLSVRSGSEPIGSAICSASAGKIGWYHNWEPAPKAGGISGAQFCPMLHDTWGGDAQMWITAWESKPQSKCYLGQNEPDLTGQDAGSVAQAFTDTFLKGIPTGDDITVACPSFTSDQSDPNKGLGWYKKFETACAGIAGCKYNTLQPHYYGYKPEAGTPEGYFGKGQPGWQNFEQFVSDVQSAAKGKKIWMTEYALGPQDGNPITMFTDKERAQFVADATEYLAGKVDAHSPYTVGSQASPGMNEMTSKDCSLATAFLQAC